MTALVTDATVGTPMVLGGVISLIVTLGLAVVIDVPAARIELIVIGLFTTIVCLLFASLRIAVYADRVDFSLGPGVIKRSIRISDVAACRVEPVSWLSGYGWRIMGRTTLVTVGGNKAVAIDLRTGKSWWLASEKAEELCTTIRAAAKIEGSGRW